jgi:hypothetical protein
VLMAQLRVYKVEQHLQHVQLATAATATVAQELQAASAVTQSAAMAASAVTYLAAPALMEHLHVRQPEAVSTTTVVARKQAYNRTEGRQIPFFLFLNKRYFTYPLSAYFNYQKFRQIF